MVLSETDFGRPIAGGQQRFRDQEISGDVCCWFEGRRVGQFSFKIPISDSSISAESLLPQVSAIVENQVGS